MSKLKGAALSVYRTALAKEKRSYTKLKRELISQFQPVRIRAAQIIQFRRRAQTSGESVGEYYRSLRELFRRTFPKWASTKDPDGEEVLRSAFMSSLRPELQQRLTVGDQELSLKALFTRTQYLEVAHLEESKDATKCGSFQGNSQRSNRQYPHSSKKLPADQGFSKTHQSKTCYNCGKQGHFAKEYRQKSTYTNQSKQASQPRRHGELNGYQADSIVGFSKTHQSKPVTIVESRVVCQRM